MSIYYNSKAIIPAPFVNIHKEYQLNEDGKQVGSLYVITVDGKFVAHKGSPNSSGVFWDQSGYPPDEVLTISEETFPAILRKQEALRKLFSNEGEVFQIQPYNGAAPITCNPRVRSIDFPKGGWYNIADYTIVLEADILYISGANVYEDQADDLLNYKVSKSSEDWSIEPTDERLITFKLTHNASATGKRFYNNTGVLAQEAWQNAKDYVVGKIGLGNGNYSITNSILNLSATTDFYNHVVVERIGERQGTYSVTETWLLYDKGTDAPAVEEFTVSTRIGEDNKVNVNIEGTITGLLTSSSKYTNALAKFNQVSGDFFNRAQTYSGVGLNSISLSQTISKNNLTGVITYAYGYDNRPSMQVPNARTESITVNYVNPADVFARIPVIGRPAGPILQNIGSTTESAVNVSIEAQLPAFGSSKPNTDSIVNGYRPGTGTTFKARDDETWNAITGRYTRQISFVRSG